MGKLSVKWWFNTVEELIKGENLREFYRTHRDGSIAASEQFWKVFGAVGVSCRRAAQVHYHPGGSRR
jgi:hypothetical protein